MKTFGIITISYKREKVLRLFCAGIKRLRNDLQMFIPVVCVGDAEHKSICDEYHIHHITQENHPASQKWNTAVAYMMSINVSYISIFGSDDICSTDLLKNLISAMEVGYDLIGVNQIYFYGGDGKHKGQLRHLQSGKTIMGVARTISKYVFEKAHPMWRKNRSWAMDGDCLRTIKPYMRHYKIVEGDVFDIKTTDAVQLNKMTYWLSKLDTNLPPDILYNILSQEEKDILFSL